jgi:hypothetical protein
MIIMPSNRAHTKVKLMIKKGFPGDIRREASFEIKNMRTYMSV